jgi:aspartate/methionine/tyrosine aminotransferase
VRTTATAEWLLMQRGVAVHPGSFYGFGESNRVVVSLLGPEAEFARGMQQIASSI